MDEQLKGTKLQFHYYFNDNSHAMDAIIRNQCEIEILSILYEIANILDAPIKIESEAHQEGGLRDIWKLANANAGVLSVIVAVASIAIPLLPKSDAELERLQKEDLHLSIQERKLRIQVLKQQVNTKEVEAETIEKMVDLVNGNYKIITRRSNLFKHLCAYPKVTKIGINELNCNGIPATPESLILRSAFKKFVLPSHKLPIRTVDNAIIEIIAPVIGQGTYKWKGIWQGQNINFSMRDKCFIPDVLNQKMSFTSGSNIRCILSVRSKLDHIGDIVITGYSVETVLSFGIDETPQSRVHRHQSNLEKAQGDLFASS
ncbi:hypothetical protein [Vibrio pectenicida]|uniref:Uncharacterized protein n=1 Tax=Vibrio pectenicida TaxID=62763 RepID=A0A3R9F8Q0_9VIBR|nr:hypothetical protein [Vibrio pectenicida]RSD32446.1 hypothetical protein EJA03_03585 [Vibrio pectenicida]